MSEKIITARHLVDVLLQQKKALGISNYAIAKSANLQQSTIKRIFDKATTPTFDTALKIAKALKLKILLENEN